MTRCMQCMKEYDGDKCPYCGYVNGSAECEHYYLPEGTLLAERYIIGKVLGHGGFGITYIGFDKKLGLRVAVKEYLPSEISTRALGETTVTTFSGDKHDAYVYGLGRFIDEAKTMAQFEAHPCIVAVKDYFEANKTAYIVMEYLDGITLGEYLKRSGGRISEEETLSIVQPIIDALKAVHGRGIIHRDISPDNIYILTNSQVKLLDFGAARHAMSEKSKSLSVVLKPGFAPPEQYYSRGKQGPWTDVYALGATMYRMLTGQNPPEAMERIEDEGGVLPEIANIKSARIKTVLTKALRLKAVERYQSISNMYDAIYDDGEDLTKEEQKLEVQAELKQEFGWGEQHKSNWEREQERRVGKKRKGIIAVLLIVAAIITIVVVASNNKTSSETGMTAQAISTQNVEATAGTIVDDPLYRSNALVISGGDSHTVGIKSDGSVVAAGSNEDDDGNVTGQCDVNGWDDIVSVCAGHLHTVGLKSDGSVVATGHNGAGQCNVGEWHDIVAISAGEYHTVGLKSDGTVVAVGSNGYGQCDVTDWTGIVSVSAGAWHTVGLKEDGTVVAVGSDIVWDDIYGGQCQVGDWTDIIAISAGIYQTIGLHSDGTVVAVGWNFFGQCNVRGWTDIVAVSAGGHTVGLKSDGTVVATGYNQFGQSDVGGWNDIIAIFTGDFFTIGMKSDGTILAIGQNYHGESDVDGWADVMLPPWLNAQSGAVGKQAIVEFMDSTLENKVRNLLNIEGGSLTLAAAAELKYLTLDSNDTDITLHKEDIELLTGLESLTMNYEYLLKSDEDAVRSVITHIAADVDVTVFVNGWYLNDADYDDYYSTFERIASFCEAIDGVDLEWPDVDATSACIDFYRGYPQWTYLAIDEWWDESDGKLQRHIDEIGGLVQLKHLSLKSNDIDDISDLKNLDSLEYLEICGSNIEGFLPYDELDNLNEYIN